MVLQAIKYERGSLQVLDQLQLPHKTVFDHVRSSEEAWHAIHDMRVRGAPAIAIVAALGLAVELANLPSPPSDVMELITFIHEKLDFLITSRPTAVNLAGAVVMLKCRLDDMLGANVEELTEGYIAAAEQMLEHDVQDNEAIGRHGRDWILNHSDQPAVSILTHCNTGSLATAGYGTALGVIRSVHSAGKLRRAFCTETRPYNQGSRLTAYELVHDQIPATLVTDSMAAALLNLKGKTENIAAIVVGADRVAANGDTANKIGTYSLAVNARAHGVKFLVAAPRTTIDMATAHGAAIKIEERAAIEMTTVSGPKTSKAGVIDLQGGSERVSIAAAGIEVWNPAFDITPADLIDGIVTEVGVAEKREDGRFDLQPLMAMQRPEDGTA